MGRVRVRVRADEDWADEDDAALRESVPLTEGGESGTRNDRAKGFAGGGRSLVIIQWYARQDPLQHIVRQSLEWPPAAAAQRPRRDRVGHRSSRDSCTQVLLKTLC